MRSFFKYLAVLVLGFVLGYQQASQQKDDLLQRLLQAKAASQPAVSAPLQPDPVQQQQSRQQAAKTADAAAETTTVPPTGMPAVPAQQVPPSAAALLPPQDDLWQPTQPFKVDEHWQAIVAEQYPTFYQPMLTYIPAQISEDLKSFLQEQPDLEWAVATEQKLRDFVQLHARAADMQLDFVRCLQSSCELLLLERTPAAVTVMFHQLMRQPWAVSQSMSRAVRTDDNLQQVHIVLRHMPKSGN